jgi:hypothetical protein
VPEPREIKTEKIRFFGPRNETGSESPQRKVRKKCSPTTGDRWEDEDLISPLRNFPRGIDMRPVIFGMERCVTFSHPAMLLGHLTPIVEELNL